MIRASQALFFTSALWLFGCAHDQVGVAVTRVAGDAKDKLAAPVCFAPVAEGLGLIERARTKELTDACAAGAAHEQMKIVPYGTPGCLIANLQWDMRQLPGSWAECTRTFGTTDCELHRNIHKSLKLRIAERDGAPSVAEANISYLSESSAFGSSAAAILCIGAFRGYPASVSNQVIHVDIDN